MRIYPPIQAADAKEMRRQGELAFTMIEIALAIGVIGFALVAIIGILPAGLNVQKDNREDTLISQDAPYFLDAIRNGAVVSNFNGVNAVNFGGPNAATSPSLDFLTNYVQSIKFVYYVDGAIASNETVTFPNRKSPDLTGAEIIGLLSAPQTNYNSQFFTSNYFDTIATVRALSGPATEQNGLNSVMAFTYQMEVMITPFNSFAFSSTNFTAPNLDNNQVMIRSNRWLEATPLNTAYSPYLTTGAGFGTLQYNLFEVRLRFSWPVFPNGSVGPGHQTYRTLIAEPLLPAVANDVNCYFFQPQYFASVPPPGL
ncbi:MAG TPA: hypothetical protein VGR14_19010 [Verrucomicrobiae bacterium]|jgi:type II secretory pathway pseudopilin PulG|nr:hypothetical protein [Verrucomicrobiae bacterium]